jgi:hypothetical protein
LTGTVVLGGQTIPVPRYGVPSPTRETIGTVEAMALYAGESVGAVRQIQPAADIIREICTDAERLLRRSTYR